MKRLALTLICLGVGMNALHADEVKLKKDYPIVPVPFTEVKVEDGFWAPRLETNRAVTIPYCFKKCEETGRIDNFAKAAGKMEGPHKGIFFDDSDVFKVIEGAAYSLAIHPDPELQKYVDELNTLIAAAQEPDGYLYTARTIDPKNPPNGSGPERWSKLKGSHELYNVGHMYEAAVAYYQATGDRTLLNVTLKSADLVMSVFNKNGRHEVPGHQEIELGLVKLYRLTGNKEYLNQAKFFLDERGYAHGRELYGDNLQDHIPVTQQDKPVGHAVRAGYMYSAMADVAALTGDKSYKRALDKIWDNMVTRRIYLTGGIGSRRHGESLGDDYELPNDSAYNETCAAIANALWNYRMFLLYGDSKYMDVVERIVYNGFLAGISLSGDRFFYPNPLACNGVEHFNQGSTSRAPWFDCSCCPVNIVRFLPSLLGYMYAHKGNGVYVNLYAAGTAQVPLKNNAVELTQETNYPWSGDIKITVKPEKEKRFTISLRVPCWVKSEPLPSDLYRYLDDSNQEAAIRVNGKPMKYKMQKGYAQISRKWQAGDVIELNLPMPVRRVVSHQNVEANKNRVALVRGPLVYCLEAVDNGGSVSHLVLPDNAELKATPSEILGGLMAIRGMAVTKADANGKSIEQEFIAIPYYAWNHRYIGEMAVWIPREEKQ